MGSVLGLVFVLIVIGVLLVIFKDRIDGFVRNLIYGVLVIVIVYWLFTLLGPIDLPGRL